MTERIQRMVNHILNETIYPPAVEVEYDRADFLLSETHRETKRLCEYILAQPIQIPDEARLAGTIKFGKFPYPADFMSKHGMRYAGELLEHFRSYNNANPPFEDFKFWEWQHATADYKKFIELGTEGIKEQIALSLRQYEGDTKKTDFLLACRMLCDAIADMADNYAEKCIAMADEANADRRAELLQLADILHRVPRYPARNFYEAVQCLYFCFDFLPDSLGLPDRWLYKYYRQDIDSGVITEDFSKELLQELYIKIQSYTPLDGHFYRGGQCNFSLGGYTVDGEDGYNDLSELLLTSLLDLPLYIPEVTFRWTKKTPTALLAHILNLSRKDKNGRIAFVSDEAKIPLITELCGIPWEEAVEYVTVGCNAIALSGGMMYSSGHANLAKALHDTLYTERASILKADSFEAFWAIFEKHLRRLLERNIEVGNIFVTYAARDECVLGSLFMRGCIESGISMTKGGAIGFADFPGDGLICTIDSLAVIRQFVYDEKTVTAEELLDALEHNWEGYGNLRQMILKKAKFFGNDDDETNEIARRITTYVATFAKKRTDALSKHFIGLIAPGYSDYNTYFGRVIGATPDGRYARDSFGVIGAGQTGGKDRNGLTALLNSVAKYDPMHFYSGITVTNVNLDAPLLYDDAHFQKTVNLIETYLANGGAQLQINTVTPEQLLDAKEHPDNYKNLRVRVSGYSDFFTHMEEERQDNIIARTILK